MRITNLIKVLCLICLSSNMTLSQAVYYPEEKPEIHPKIAKKADMESMPSLPIDQIKVELKDTKDKQKPYKFGHLNAVNFSLSNSGTWTTLDNGDRIWQLQVHAPEALSININYSKFNIPKGSKLYVYNKDQTDILGPFTKENQKESGAFATGFTKGEHCIIEYYEPVDRVGRGKIVISGIVHGFRSLQSQVEQVLRDFQDAGPCHYDVACGISAGWEDQIKSVGLLLTASNTSGCTGTLINTTANNCEPYFLTADHCFPNDNPGDMLNNIFVFNFESPDAACPGISISPGPVNQTISGCSVVSKSEETDFCLLRLSANPIDFYDVYYSGWDRRNIAAPSVVGIHHASGDVKKFSVEQDPVISSDDDLYWLVPDWDFGSTEAGASGSAVFDASSRRILGQLCCGNADCDGSSNNGGEDDYGKIYASWDQLGPASTQQLKPWLDPGNTGALFIDGGTCPIVPVADILPAAPSDIHLCGPTTMKFKDFSVGQATSWSWTFSGAGVSPTSSTDQNPEVTINSAGNLTVSLMVSNAQGDDMITYSYPVVFYNCTDDTYCNTTAVSIPDNNSSGVSSDITIPASFPLIDLNIELDITHEFVGDLTVLIEHNGITARILAKPNHPINGCQEDNINATFDDEASTEAQLMCETTGTAISGDVIPFSALSVFNNIDPTGTWKISVIDDSDEDTGTLNSWCLKARTTTQALPVELIGFNAYYNQKKSAIQLDWSTASEINNELFIVEKSIDNKEWKGIRTIKAAGNTSNITQYSHNDYEIVLGQTQYYRLRQVDFDGAFSYSSVEDVHIPEDVKELIHVFPNPASLGELITLTNMGLIKELKVFSTVGQEIKITGNTVPDNLSAGIYLLSIELHSGQYEFKKLMIQ